ncbi:MAG: restriction endonuclease, partial [Bacteroidales bacterium]|nr:restriction endonuclease [Bacteroidales bacterium]
TAKYLIIHNKSNKYAAFFMNGKGPRLISADEMTDMVTTKKGASVYLVYQTDLKAIPALGELDFTPITKSGDSYSPHLLNIKSLIKK